MSLHRIVNCPCCGTKWQLTLREAAQPTFSCEECQTIFNLGRPIFREHQVQTLPLETLMPLFNSKGVYIVVMACCADTLNNFVSKIVALFCLQPSITYDGPITKEAVGEAILDALFYGVIIETLVLVAIIEGARRLRLSSFWQLTLSVIVLSATHIPGFAARALIVAPAFVIFAYSYMDWRRKSWKIGFVICAAIHSAANVIPVLDFIRRKIASG